MGLDIDVGIKNSRVRSGLAQIRSEVGKFSGSIGGMLVGAFSVGAVVAFAEKMREVQNRAARLGTSAESVQRIGKAARSADVDFEALAKAINKVTLEAGKAAGGDKAAKTIFKDLGLDAAAFLKLNMQQKLVALSGAYRQAESSGRGSVAVLDLLGERGTEIIPILAKGPKALADGMKEATVQTNATVAAFADLDRKWQKMKGVGAQVLSTTISIGSGMFQRARAFMNKGDDEAQAKREMEAENAQRVKDGLKPYTGGAADTYIRNRTDELQQQRYATAMGANQPEPSKADDIDANAADAGKIAEMRKGIEEDEARNRADALTGEAKLNELLKQRQELADKLSEDTVVGLEAKKRDLELEQQIQELQKAGERRFKEANERRADALEREYLANASTAQKKAYLTEKQQRLNKEADAMDDRSRFEKPRSRADALDKEADADEVAGKRFTAAGKRSKAGELRDQADEAEKIYDPAKAVQRRTEADSLQSEIARLGGRGRGTIPTIDSSSTSLTTGKLSSGNLQTGSLNDVATKVGGEKGPGRLAVAVDSLQRAGGGGRAVAASDPAQRSRDKQTALLQQIRDALKQGEVKVGTPKDDSY